MMLAMLGFGAMGAGFMCFVPTYWLPIFCVLLGYMLRMTWKQTLQFTLVAVALTIGGAFYFDYVSQNLVSKKIGAILQVPPPFVPLLPGFLMAWIGIFFSQLGSSTRTILKK